MRVTDSMMREGAVHGLNTNAMSLLKLQEQVSSGKLLNRPSDDPAQVRQAIKIRDALSELGQFTRNINAADRTVSAADAALGGASGLLQRASELAIQGANGSYSASDRQKMGLEVDQIAQELVQLASTKVADAYIFSGFQTETPPYASPAGGYQGDAGAVMARVAPGATVQVNLIASAVFGPALAALQQLGTELAAGTAVTAGTISALGAAQDTLLGARAALGALQNRLDDTSDVMAQAITAAKQLLSETAEVDMAAAITEYSERQLTYNAALKVNAQIMQTSLFDYLR
jgi:flagellar hook-associated protein 3 FlgL